MSQLRSNILHKKKKAEIEKSKKLYRRNHIATPIQPYNENDNDECEASDITISDDEGILQNQEKEEESDLENDKSDIISSTEKWVHLIKNWMDMVGEENYSDNNMIDPLEFVAVDHTIHPADDPLVKWDLNSIFNDRFETPDFVNALVNLG